MIYLVEKGENKSKYEIRKVKYIESCKCNKLNIQYKDKVTNAYEEATITIWGEQLAITPHNWEKKTKGDEIQINKVSAIGLNPEYKGKRTLNITVPSDGFSLIRANWGNNGDTETTTTAPQSFSGMDDFLPF